MNVRTLKIKMAYSPGGLSVLSKCQGSLPIRLLNTSYRKLTFWQMRRKTSSIQKILITFHENPTIRSRVLLYSSCPDGGAGG